MTLRTLDSLGSLEGKVVGVRLDLNVPLSGGEITDDGRIRAAIPTLEHLASSGAVIVAMSHLGRPDGTVNPDYSLAPVARRLQELWAHKVHLVGTVAGPEVDAAIRGAAPGDIVLRENLRFDSRETSADPGARQEFAELLAQGLDAVVSDGFGVVHRAQASVVELEKLLPSAAGFLVATEVSVLNNLRTNPERPYTVVLGGSKVSDKLGVIDALLPVVDQLVIGGGMVFTVLAATGHKSGASLLEPDQIATVKGYLDRAEQLGVEVVLPSDIVMAESFSPDAPHIVLPIDSLESGPYGDTAMGLDIGPDSASHFAEVVSQSKTVFWNGPMGVFEFDAFAEGTAAVARAMTQVSGLGVVGGGDSAAAVRTLGFSDDEFGHISTGGGASLEFLEGKTLPGLDVLGW